MSVNDRAYWEERFGGDWEEKLGREQTRFFARVALRGLPRPIAQEVREGRLSICDFGCALGDAVPELALAFPGSPLTGIDFAPPAIERARALYPGHEFAVASSLGELQRSFDVVYCSNTLEHFVDPMGPLTDLAAAARRYLLLLVPYRGIL